MFKRKVLVVALLAIVLVASFLDVNTDVIKRHRIKPRAAVESGITAVVTSLNQAVDSISAAVQGDQQFALREHKPRHRRAELNSAGSDQASTFLTAGVPDDQAARLREQKPRKRRLELNTAGLNQIAGGIAAVDPTD